MVNPKVSIIITTKNEEDVLERLLKSIDSQSYKQVEIIIVDNKSSDKTKEVAKKYTDKVFNKGPERSAQRNFGAKKAVGRYLLFLDADMELTEKVVTECVEAIEKSKKIGAVSIPEISIASTFWERVKAFERSFYNLDGDDEIDAARFFPKKIFNIVGGYDVSITGPEDWDLPERIAKKGYKTSRIKSKIKHHERVPNPIKLAQKKFYYGLRAHRYLSKHGINPVGAKTIYFLRPVFYHNWRRLVSHPILSVSMFIMLILEQFGGGLGYIIGKYKDL